MAEIKKIRRTALLLSIIIGAFILWFGFEQGRVLFEWLKFFPWDRMSTYIFVSTFVYLVLIMLPILTTCITFLMSIKKDETPFNIKNVRRLKIIAVLLMIFEAGSYLGQFLSTRIHNAEYGVIYICTIIDGEHIGDPFSGYSTLSGVVFATGLVIYCIALVFQYGITLQEQIDETL